jgi:aerobic-type carbon monoxide dehydrogenase small subunit (CoxS/CutS family)
MKQPIRFRLNGEPAHVEVEEERKLLWVLRTELGLTGPKYGCGAGLCGACTVVVDGQAVRSCLAPITTAQDKEVVTVEGLADDGRLHPLQEAFLEQGGFQCGYCTPGMIMSAYALLLREPRPSRQAILEGMEQNLCRCGAHQRIVAAIESAAHVVGGGS